jgi:hypothetical protein
MREKQKEQNMATSDQITELPLTHKQITRGVLEFIKGKLKKPSTVREPVKYGQS